jgi:uncharacterized protein YndB with AHSA1/START domain
MTAAAKTAPYENASVTVTCVFDAPRVLVWKTWTDPKMMARWFRPRGFTNPVCELDLRVGGSLRIVMRGPDGGDYPMKGVFREVIMPERLVFTNIAVDKEANICSRARPQLRSPRAITRPLLFSELTQLASFRSLRKCSPVWKRGGHRASANFKNWVAATDNVSRTQRSA